MRALLANAGFALKPNGDRSTGSRAAQSLPQQGTKVFLNACLGWWIFLEMQPPSLQPGQAQPPKPFADSVFGYHDTQAAQDLFRLAMRRGGGAVAAGRTKLLEPLHRRMAEQVPYRVLGRSSMPVAFRSNVTDVLESPILVYWNIDKNEPR